MWVMVLERFLFYSKNIAHHVLQVYACKKSLHKENKKYPESARNVGPRCLYKTAIYCTLNINFGNFLDMSKCKFF